MYICRADTSGTPFYRIAVLRPPGCRAMRCPPPLSKNVGQQLFYAYTPSTLRSESESTNGVFFFYRSKVYVLR